MSGLVDIGYNIQIEAQYLAGKIEGFDWMHTCNDRRAAGWIPVNSPKGWQLVSEDPVTLAPSIRCTVCNCHGYIRNGKWVPV